MIVIVATSVDPHADLVVEHLTSAGTPHQRIDLEAPQQNYKVSVSGGASRFDWALNDVASGRHFCRDDISAIWWRRSTSQLFQTLPKSSAEVDQIETGQALRWLLEGLPATLFPFGHPVDLRRAENKFRQLEVASSVGFNIPDYIYTNAARDARKFVERNDGAIIKSLSQAVVELSGEERSFCASKVSISQLTALNLPDASWVAAFLQMEIRREKDVRAFIGQGWSFAVEIALETLPDGEIDWRPYIENCNHLKTVLPIDVVEKAELFLARAGIPCGHFDFVVDIDSTYHFLECNPNGQWAWLEMMAGSEISTHIAHALIQFRR